MSDVALRFTAADGGLTAQFGKTNQQLADLEKHAANVSKQIQSDFTALKTAIGAVAIGALSGQIGEYADQVTKASARTGIQVEAIQKLQFIAGQADVDFDRITDAVNKFQRQLVDGGKNTADALGV